MSTATSPRYSGAFVVSALMHALLIVLALLLAWVNKQAREADDTPKIIELVAGEGENLEATVAPAFGVPGGVKLPDIQTPEIPPIRTVPDPEPQAMPMQAVPEPPVAAPIKPEPVAPPKTEPKTAAKPKPEPKPVDMAKLVDRIADKRAANIEKKFKAEQKAAAEKAEREAKKLAEANRRMSEAEFRRLNGAKGPASPGKDNGPISTRRVDTEGILTGVRDGSTSNKVGGQGGKALSRAEQDLMDTYRKMVTEKVKTNHEQPTGVSEALVCEIEVQVSTAGAITRSKVVASSGVKEFDQSVLAAAARTRMVKGPPNGKTDTFVIVFNMRDAG